MSRILGILGLAVAFAGCQAQNPYSVFGPQRVPTPGMQTPAPYYPPTAGAAAAASPPSAGAATGRQSVSADSPPRSLSAPKSTEAGDREPIRIVENPAPAARTAAAPKSAGGAAPPPTRDKSSSTHRRDDSIAPAVFEATAETGQWKSR